MTPGVRRHTAMLCAILLAAASPLACGSERDATRTTRVRLGPARALQSTVAGAIVTATAVAGSGAPFFGTSSGGVYTAAANGQGAPRSLVKLTGKIMAVDVSGDGTTFAAVSVDGGIAVGRVAGR